jgi:hypothetical protein
VERRYRSLISACDLFPPISGNGRRQIRQCSCGAPPTLCHALPPRHVDVATAATSVRTLSIFARRRESPRSRGATAEEIAAQRVGLVERLLQTVSSA